MDGSCSVVFFMSAKPWIADIDRRLSHFTPPIFVTGAVYAQASSLKPMTPMSKMAALREFTCRQVRADARSRENGDRQMEQPAD
jgi:hypothetical protein